MAGRRISSSCFLAWSNESTTRSNFSMVGLLISSNFSRSSLLLMPVTYMTQRSSGAVMSSMDASADRLRSSSHHAMPSWPSCCLFDMNCTRLKRRGIFSLKRLLITLKQQGIPALFGNMGAVSVTSLLMRLATSSSMQAMRNAC